jgi:hypothetical protein
MYGVREIVPEISVKDKIRSTLFARDDKLVYKDKNMTILNFPRST